MTIHDTLFETHPQFFTKGFRRMARLTGRRSVKKARCPRTGLSALSLVRKRVVASRLLCHGLRSQWNHDTSLSWQ